jgi:hypothetical protein
MKKFLIAVFAISFAGSIYCQTRCTSKAFQIQFEVLGLGIFSSLNIDSRFTNKENGIGYRIGIGITPLGFLKHSCNTGSLNSFPLALNYLMGKSKNLLEVGGGSVLSFMSGTKVYCIDSTNMEKSFFSEETTNYWFMSLGYRFQDVHKKGLSYRVFISPLFQNDFSTKFWGGASIGYRF